MNEEKILAVRVELTGISDETRQITELNDELQKLSLRRKELNKAIVDNGKATKEESEELLANEQSTRDLNEAKGQLMKTEKLTSREFKAATGSMNELRAKTAALRNEANNLNLTTTEGQRRFKELGRQINTNTTQIRNYDRSISGSSTLVGEYSRGIMNAFTKVGTAVAAAWSIIKAGEKIIYSAQGASDQWEKTIGGLKGGLDDLFKSLATGDFSGFLKGITEAIKAGQEYAEVLDDLQDRLRQYKIAEVDAQIEILQKKKIMRDVTKTDQERLEAAESVDAIEKKLAEDKEKNMRIAFEAERERTAQHTRWSEDELMYYVKNYDQLTQSLKIGEDYIKVQDDIQRAMVSSAKTGMGVSKELLDKEKMLAEQGGEYWARYVQNRNRANDEELDSLVRTYVDMQNAQKEYEQNTQRVDSSANRLRDDMRKDQDKKDEESQKKHEAWLVEYEVKIAELEMQRTKLETGQMVKLEGRESGLIAQEISINEDPEIVYALQKIETLAEIKRQAYVNELSALEDALKRGEMTEGEYLQRRAIAYQVAFQGTTQDVIAGLSDMAGALEAFGEESKALTLFKIGIDTASAISSLVAMSEANPANAVTMGAAGIIQYISGLIRIFANIATARKVIKGKYTGGEIGADDGVMLTKPTPHGDNMLIVAKKGEVVLNERQQSYFGKDAFRSAGVPGFAGGGMVGSAGLNYAPSGGMDIERMIKLMASVINDKKVYLSMDELKETDKQYTEIRTSAEL